MIKLNGIVPVYSLFLLILIITGNFIAELLPCRFQRTLRNNMYVKYFFAFFTLFFFIVLSSDETLNLVKLFYQSIIVFFWFMLLIKTTSKIFLTNCFLFFIIYIIYLIHEDERLKNNYKDKLVIINNILIILSFILTLCGFILYMGEQKKKYGSKFQYKFFLFGKPICSKGKDKYIPIKESLKYSFS